jgi:hypothetical protein
MKNPSFASFVSLLEEIGHAFYRAARYTARAMATMSWPAMLVTCIGLALAITIIPLALFLFIAFMLVKLIIAAIILSSRRRRALPHNTIDQQD